MLILRSSFLKLKVFYLALSQEKQEETFRKSIEGFSKDALRHSHTTEKNVLPDAVQISKEKTLEGISHFNKEQLKQVGE